MPIEGFAALDRALDTLPATYAGPEGAAAVLRDGKPIASRSWGFADTERRIAFTPRTLLLDMVGDPAALDADVARALPRLSRPPSARALCDNQSGMRDYWALAMLCGAPVEGVFGDVEARRLIEETRSLHFAPGARYSYCNQNFRVLGDCLAARAGRGFGELLREKIFDRVGMEHAILAADTSELPDGTLGYEGSVEHGFRPAVNRIVWTGDAGIGACLDDMIAWEAFIDATRDDADGLYRRLSAPATFADGASALYGFGLGQGSLAGLRITGHGGGLRGWRSYRLHCAAERVSVVVLFNHMADAREAAAGLFTALLGETAPSAEAMPVDPAWAGAFLEPESGLAVRLEPAGARVRLHYGTVAELVDPAKPYDPASGAARLFREADGVWMERPGENFRGRLVPVDSSPRRDIEGVFRCAYLDSELSVVSAGGVLHGACEGFLGQGEMQALAPVAGDVWRMPCARALDYHAPGDWTLAFARDDSGRVSWVRVGCWLARGLEYVAA